jgi:hypothetical protein
MNRRWRDDAGVATQPLLAMFTPFFALFMTVVQLGFIEVASLVTTHSANLAARCASVVLPDDPRYYDGVPVGEWSGARRRQIDDSAKIPLSIFDKNAKVEVSLRNRTYSGNAPVRVQVAFDFPCTVPLGQWILCGKKKTFRIEREAEMPNQGAGYAYP